MAFNVFCVFVLCLFVGIASVEAKICPNQAKTCPEFAVCCLMLDGAYGCCPYKNGECCPDRIHCCPPGSHCDSGKSTCTKNQGLSSIPWLQPLARDVPEIILPAEDGEAVSRLPTELDPAICPNGQKCPMSDTCCSLADGVYGCCPMANAVCCADHQHCCPRGSRCDAPRKRCVENLQFIIDFYFQRNSRPRSHSEKEHSVAEPLNPVESIYLIHDTPFVSLSSRADTHDTHFIRDTHLVALSDPMEVERNACADGSSCGNSQTCCRMLDNAFGCCPYQNATCCADSLHCCPYKYTCDVKESMCKKPDSMDNLEAPMYMKLFAVKTPSIKIETEDDLASKFAYNLHHSAVNVNIIEENALEPTSSLQDPSRRTICPDHKSVCPSKNTCCKTRTGEYGCCPLVKATCCKDGLSCCPNNYVCTDGGCERRSLLGFKPKMTREKILLN